jgi:hypothetical protein
MFVIGNAVLDDRIRETKFACDLEVCKGACCCVEGWRGAPLADSELSELRAAFPAAAGYLSARNLRAIEEHGLYEGSPGDYATACVGAGECVFVYFEEGIARCSLERAYREGKTDWPKPLSCHLYPVRVRSEGRDYLQYHELPQCQGGCDRGAREHIPLHRFLEDPLTRAYGRAWYAKLRDECEPSSRG